MKKKNPAAIELGKLGASKGGYARAAKMTPQERSDAARRAVEVRWKGHMKKKPLPLRKAR
jgi:hypothetical protein